MDHFFYRDHEAFCEELSLNEIAQALGTPAYVYSSATLSRHCAQFKDAFASHPTSFCYAIKANSNLSLLKQIFSAGFGADIVSQGELERALLAGATPDKLVYSGVGKTEPEIVRALELGILSFNIESFFELELITKIAKQLHKKAPISLRVNPDIDAKTHPKISTGMHSSKFGIALEQVDSFLEFIEKNKAHIELVGLACHIGSQLTDLLPIDEAAQEMVRLLDSVRARGFAIRYLNMGGGLGIRYTDESAPSIADYAETLLKHIRKTGIHLIVEPGRVLVGNCGVLLTSVVGLKETPEKKFIVVDAAMNDLIRPTLYGSQHEFRTVKSDPEAQVRNFDIVGPICETGDFLGLNQHLPPLKSGDLIYIRTCGAYGSVMSSNYNSRPRAVEVLVEGKTFRVIRKREQLSDLWEAEI